MGTVLSSPRRTSGVGVGVDGVNWHQLRQSKSTFSLKERGNGNGPASSGGIGGSSSSGGGGLSNFFRNGLASSVSFRNLSIGGGVGGGGSSGGSGGGGHAKRNGSNGKLPPHHQSQHKPQRLHRLQTEVPVDSAAAVPAVRHSAIPLPLTVGGEGGKAASPVELKSSDRRNNNNQLAPNRLGLKGGPGGGLTKSTSCYAFKPSPPRRPSATTAVATLADNKENSSSSSSSGGNGTSSDSRRLVIQASTTELLKCTGTFLSRRCPEAACDPAAAAAWIRSVDRCLILQGWADMAFVNPPNLVFLFMLLKTAIGNGLATERQLQSAVFTCMYLAYSYMGNEISYPLKPFLVEDDRDAFWDRCLGVAGACSADMLRMNSDPTFFIDLFTELKSYS